MDRSHIAVIGAPLDLGAGRRGVDMGPSAIRVAQLNARLTNLGYIIDDCGNVEVEQPESRPSGPRNAHYLAEIHAVCERLAKTTRSALDKGHLPLVLGGDHSVAMGTIGGVAAHYRAQAGRRVGVIWVDAHADMNTPETSPSGNVHGMPLACAIGLGPPELTGLAGFAPSVEAVNVALVGIRDVDQLEKPHVKESGVRAFTMREIDERGLRAVMAEAIRIATAGTAGFHLSLDMDVVDPVEAPGVGTPVRGGITYREAHLAMEVACDSRQMVSMEVVEVNPVLDVANRTADLAVELVMSALGKRIL
jgi:arginase